MYFCHTCIIEALFWTGTGSFLVPCAPHPLSDRGTCHSKKDSIQKWTQTMHTHFTSFPKQILFVTCHNSGLFLWRTNSFAEKFFWNIIQGIVTRFELGVLGIHESTRLRIYLQGIRLKLGDQLQQTFGTVRRPVLLPCFIYKGTQHSTYLLSIFAVQIWFFVQGHLFI